jgi:hypothetical protein
MKLVAKIVNNKNNYTKMFTIELYQIEKANNFSWTWFARFKSKVKNNLGNARFVNISLVTQKLNEDKQAKT